jgi:hypothetical protein
MTVIPQKFSQNNLWNRDYLLSILKSGLITNDPRFVRRATLAWLSAYPGDLPVQLLQAQALAADGILDQAATVLENLVQTDPENEAAQVLLLNIRQQMGVDIDDTLSGSAIALKSGSEAVIAKNYDDQAPKWADPLLKTRQSLAKGLLPEAEIGIQQLLGVAPDTPLSAVTHLQVLRAQKSTPAAGLLNLAQHYRNRWPQCIQFGLILAEARMNTGATDQAVALLHWAAAQDVSGQVVTRLWGAHHPYQNLWPTDLQAVIDIQIPSGVAAHLGWNLLYQGIVEKPREDPKLPKKTEFQINDEIQLDTPDIAKTEVILLAGEQPETGEENHPEPPPTPKKETESLSPTGAATHNNKEVETLKSAQKELEKVARRIKRPDIAKADGRFPVYVVFTTQQGLKKKYGADTTTILDQSLRKLVAAIRKRLAWGAILVYADDPTHMAQFGLQPAIATSAWELKLALTDLDTALATKGARIGAVLIVGGPEVVPFHRLPNPTDDNDADVPSDNPYTTRDENYFIPEWPVGRLPGGKGSDPGLLLSAIRAMITRHRASHDTKQSLLKKIISWLATFWPTRSKTDHSSFGMSAEAWKDASISIFRLIGDPSSLATSPPEEIPALGLPATNLGYFNLHGVPDSAEWFGQRDPVGGADGPDYPTALLPHSIQNSGKAPQVVFSEACYGAHIIKKSVEEALALKFLAAGSQAVIGSTVVSYGSVSPPLNAADLLGKAFWRFLKNGYPAGEALCRAKIFLAKEMHKRQGFLDGEDQKTLISFVLYGDPLTQIADLPVRAKPKTMAQFWAPPPEVKTICDRATIPGTSEPIPKSIMAHVKQVVEEYLPGMRGAQLSLSQAHTDCDCKGHNCPSQQLGPKTKPAETPHRQVVTLSKSVVRAKRVHESFARVTINKEGKIVKLAVSR